VGAVGLVDSGHDQGPGVMERKDGLCCSHVGSKKPVFSDDNGREMTGNDRLAKNIR
jgi:hypothetical protein